MNINVAHSKNSVLGWDIAIVAQADNGENIASARVVVNGIPEFSQQIPGLTRWQKTLIQQGQYPGDNTVVVTVVNDKGEQTIGEDEWQ